MLSLLIALCAPTLMLISLIEMASFPSKYINITLVKHTPRPDHTHSRGTTIGVIWRSLLLGVLLTIGMSMVDQQLQQHLVPFGLYIMIVSFFHFSEYFVTSLTNPSTLDLDSFLLNNKSTYAFALIGSSLEYILSLLFLPECKKFNIISLFGLSIAIIGEIIRKTAMFTAGQNFTHIISTDKKPEHKLVTYGIYSYFRHPSYSGWFYWAVGTQILLLNPFSLVVFSILSWIFFSSRIEYEEQTLVKFFGRDYEEYRKNVGVYIPFVNKSQR